jgi:hypothetical protein
MAKLWKIAVLIFVALLILIGPPYVDYTDDYRWRETTCELAKTAKTDPYSLDANAGGCEDGHRISAQRF